MIEFPKEWRIAQHNDVAEINPGLVLNRYSDDLDVSFLPMKTVQEVTGKYDLSQIRKIKEVKKGYTPVIDGDVIFAKITPCMENGKIAVMAGLKNHIGFGSTEFHVSRPHSGVGAKYLFYYFVQSKFREIARRQMTGSAGQLRVPTEYFRSFKLPITATKEQEHIVAKIEELFSDLDNAIENLKKAQEQLKVYRQAVLKYSFEGKWEKVLMQSISEAFGGCAFKSSDFKESGSYQVIRIGNVRPGTMRLNISPVFLDVVEQKVIDKYLLKPGDVVISLTGTRKKRDYGYTTIVKEENLLLNQRLARLRFNEECLPKFFLYYSWTQLFKDSFFASETGNVGQGNVGMKAIQHTEMPLPSIQEQQKIIQTIESRFSVCDKIEESIDENLLKAEALRQSILKQAFEGKLTEQWRKYHKDLISGENSVEALFKKIKAEKEALLVKLKGKKKHD